MTSTGGGLVKPRSLWAPLAATDALYQHKYVLVGATTYFVVCEALANIVKHADTQHADISIRRPEDTLVISATDHGRGGVDTHGGGIVGLMDRVKSLVGWLEIPSTTSGTALVASIPCQ